MKFLLRTLLTIVAAMWIAMPTVGNEGGGETGVWILPVGSSLSGPPMGAGQSYQITDFSKNLAMVVAPNCGLVMATVCDPISAATVSLTVSGRDVMLQGSTIRAFSDAQVESLDLVIVDQFHVGYRMAMTIDAAMGTATLRIQ